VPGLSVTVSVLLPPLNVGVAPTVGPLVPCWIVKLWATCEEFVKLIVTLPALADSEDFVNFSAPLGSADCVSAAPPPPAAEDAEDADVDVAGLAELELAAPPELDVAAELDELLLDPPHAARPSASAPALSMGTASRNKSDLLRAGC
jgi:hypothetical protein